MKKDKLYTVSKYSADRINEKANLFYPGGFLTSPGMINLYNRALNSSTGSNSSTGGGTGVSISRPDFGQLGGADLNKLDASAGFSNTPSPLGGYTEGQLGVDLSKDRNYPNPPKNWNNNNQILNNVLGAVGAVGNPLASRVISGGYSTGGVGEGVAGIGNVASQFFQDPITKVAIGLGSGILGGVINRGWGVKRNNKNIASIKANTGELRTSGNQLASATTNEAFMDAAANMGSASGFKGGDLVKGGWFSGGKAAREANRYLNAEKQALAYQTHAMAQGAKNVDKIQDDNVMANFAAMGGSLNDTEQYADGGYMGALEYGLALDALEARRRSAEMKNKIPSNPFGALAVNPFNGYAEGGILFGNGGPIIKEENRGKFTAQAKAAGMGTQQFASHVLANKEDYSPTTVKRANFAHVFGGRNYNYGGPLFNDNNLFDIGGVLQSHGSDWSNGSSHIDEGGTHEENPNQGVQVGVDPEGTPNLVEEGEIIYSDYVYSQRIELDDEAKERFHFSKKQDITYADAAKKLEKEISERPNDPLSKAAFKSQMQDLAEEQERQKAEMQAEEAREQFESLSPEEQVAVMQNAEAQEQQAAEEEAMMQEQIAQEQAMQEQAAMQGQPTEEQMMQEQMMAQQQGMMPQQPMGMEAQMGGYAYGGLMGNQYGMGGNLFVDGGLKDALAWVKKNLKVGPKDASWIARAIWKEANSNKSNYYRPQSTSMFGNNNNREYAWDYGMAYKALLPKTTSGRESAFNKLVKDGMPRNLAFGLTFPNSGADATNPELIKKRNDAYQRLVVQSQQSQPSVQEKAKPSAGYRGADGKLYSTLEEANAAGGNRQISANKPSAVNSSAGVNVTFKGLNGTKKTWEEESKGWNRNQNTNQEIARVQPIEEFINANNSNLVDYSNTPAVRDTTSTPKKSPVTNNTSTPKPSVAQEKKSGLYAGEWIEGDSSANWNNYSSVGLKNYLNDVVKRINNAENDEQKNNIRQEAINKVAQIQQAYARAYQPDITPTSERPEVYTLQELFDDAGGNAGFEKIAENIKKSNAARNKDTAANNWRDSLWGPRTSIRNWGSTEYGTGNQDYYNEIAGLATQAGLQYAPNASWTYGKDAEGNPYQLYGLSRAGTPQPAANPNVYHAVEGDEDYLPASTDINKLGKETRRTTLPNGDTVIYHAPGNGAANNGTEAAAVPQPTGQGNGNREVAPVLQSEWPRYAGLMGPVVGLGMMAAGIGKPNLSDYEAALDIVNKGGSFASYMPIGNYLKYQPMDIWANQNRMDANSRATDRAILNNASPVGTRNAGLVANSYASQLGSGELYKNALQYNDNLMQNVGTFNRATDMFNAEAFNRTSATNAEIRNRDRQLRAQLGMQTAAEKAAANAGWYNSLYGNVAGLFKGISDLGRENAQRNMISRLAAAGAFGTLTPENAVGAGLVKWADEEDKKKKRNWLGL